MRKFFRSIINKISSIFKSSDPGSQASHPVTDSSRPGLNEPGSKLLWYPLARIIPGMKTSGEYPDSYPMGAVIHFTAGRDKTEQEAQDTLSWGMESGYAFFVIGPTGKVYQSAPLNRYGSHAGNSNWPGLGSSVSRKLVGIEVACAGELNAHGTAWFGEHYELEDIRVVDQSYECPAGIYKKFTEAQETALTDLLLWLKSNHPLVFDFDNVLGHHEVSGLKGIGYWRKSDPGGSLSMPMSKYRDYLKKKFEV